MVHKFWKHSRLPKGCNNAFIALIMKSVDPEGLKDYRPISIVGVYTKLCPKLLVKRPQAVMDSLVGATQSSIKGSQILDGVLIANELIESCKRHNAKAILLKLDFH